MDRVVITGVGPLASIGIGARDFAAALRAGRSAIAPIESFDPVGFPHHMAGEMRGFEPDSWVRNISPGEWGPASVFAAAAARLALDDAGIDPEQVRRSRAGSVIGTTSGESQVIERAMRLWIEDGPQSLPADRISLTPSYRMAVAVNRELGLTGEAVTLATACSASNYAIGYAYDLIRNGDADFMIAGGADAMCRFAVAGFYRLGALTKEVCSPFDAGRSGILIGEGGAAMFLESLDSAVARNARIYAEVLGYGLTCDASHMVSPDSGSIARCMRRAHRNAGIKAAEVDYISAHGTGTPSNDTMEGRAVLDVFGDNPPPISSIKSMLGHTMGAASCFGAIASVLGISGGFLPPTINHTRLDPELTGFDVVPNQARDADLRIVQNNGFAFGGNNAITIFGRPE
ncbi:MAG TPA: beta-ketoacyl-[acyl-carrier-protein] synthase family protein [Actinocrinis sp.]|nr:beta-ketoacyl-[acyl-carrier-protein] synthase family protein [Actinocrinis sp.]